MTQYYCAIFYSSVGSEREMMSSDSDAAFVATALAFCLIHKKNRRWIKEWYKRRPTIHATIS